MRLHRWLGPLAAALLASCASYGAPDSVTFGTAVYTQAAPGFDPAPLGTYFLDTLITVKEDNTETTMAMPAAVVSAIDANMAALGYVKGGSGARPPNAGEATVGLKMVLIKGTGAIYYPGYWCDYWYYYSCYYDWYYAGSYSFGSLVLEMGDLRGYTGSPLPQLSILWGSLIYGVATSGTYDVQRAVEGVNRAFAQSPYLKR